MFGPTSCAFHQVSSPLRPATQTHRSKIGKATEQGAVIAIRAAVLFQMVRNEFATLADDDHREEELLQVEAGRRDAAVAEAASGKPNEQREPDLHDIGGDLFAVLPDHTLLFDFL